MPRGVEPRGKIIKTIYKYGIAFSGKNIEVVVE